MDTGSFIEMETSRQQFAAFLQRLANNEVTLGDWDLYVVAHYLDETLEAVRRDVVRLAQARNGGPYSLEDNRSSWNGVSFFSARVMFRSLNYLMF
jgi:hypothetical protein